MDKNILNDYIDACKLIEETEADIKRLQKKKKTVIQTNVKGSNPEFPYQPQHFMIQGTPFTYTEDSQLRLEEKLLENRKANAEKIKLDVDQWMLTVPARMQRIIRFKFFVVVNNATKFFVYTMPCICYFGTFVVIIKSGLTIAKP